MDFDNYEDIVKYVRNSGKEVLEDVAKQIKEEIFRYIDENLYNAYEPVAYDRTYEYRDSVVVKPLPKRGARLFGFRIELDYSKITPSRSANPNSWNAHMSVTGKDVSKYIPKWIDQGTTGGLYPRTGIHLFDFIERLFNDKDILVRRINNKFGDGAGKELGGFTFSFRFNLDRL